MRIRFALAIKLLPFFIVLALTTGLALAQQPAGDRVGELERRLEILEQQVGSRGDATGGEVSAIADIARMTMDSYKSNFDLIKTVATIVSSLVLLIISGFAFFGVRRYRQIISMVENERKKVVALRETLGEHEKRGRDITDALKTVEGKIQTNVKGWIQTASAFTDVCTLGGRETVHLKPALRDIEDVIATIKPTDPKILAWAYSIRGYILRRIIGPEEGLESLEQLS